MAVPFLIAAIIGLPRPRSPEGLPSRTIAVGIHWGFVPSPVGINGPVTLTTGIPLAASFVRKAISVSPATPIRVLPDGPDHFLIMPKSFWPDKTFMRLTITLPRPPGMRRAPSATRTFRTDDGREIRVNLTTQTLSLWEAGRLIARMPTSTGTPPRWTTPSGVFWIYRRVADDHMQGGEPGTKDAWDVQHVPWAQYFYKGIAIHGAWWNHRFGRPVSHGCVQLSTRTAPPGHWGSDEPNAERVWKFAHLGTPVIIHGQTPITGATSPLAYPPPTGWRTFAGSSTSSTR